MADERGINVAGPLKALDQRQHPVEDLRMERCLVARLIFSAILSPTAHGVIALLALIGRAVKRVLTRLERTRGRAPRLSEPGIGARLGSRGQRRLGLSRGCPRPIHLERRHDR